MNNREPILDVAASGSSEIVTKSAESIERDVSFGKTSDSSGSQSKDSLDDRQSAKKNSGSITCTSSEDKDFVTVNESPSRTDDLHSDDNVHEESKLFVGALNAETTSPMLLEYFQQFGKVCDAIVMRDLSTGQNRCFGFVSFVDKSVAEHVLSVSHVISGKLVDVKKAIPRTDYQRSDKIFVGGLPQNMSSNELREFFQTFGVVLEAQVMTKKHSGKARGFGFVTFQNDSAVANIMSLQKEGRIFVKNKRVEVKRALPKHKLPIALSRPFKETFNIAESTSSVTLASNDAVFQQTQRLSSMQLKEQSSGSELSFRSKQSGSFFPIHYIDTEFSIRQGLNFDARYKDMSLPEGLADRRRSFKNQFRSYDGLSRAKGTYVSSDQYTESNRHIAAASLPSCPIINDIAYTSAPRIDAVRHSSVLPPYPVSPAMSSRGASHLTHSHLTHSHLHHTASSIFPVAGMTASIAAYYPAPHHVIYSPNPHIGMASPSEASPTSPSGSHGVGQQQNIPSYSGYMYYPANATTVATSPSGLVDPALHGMPSHHPMSAYSHQSSSVDNIKKPLVSSNVLYSAKSALPLVDDLERGYSGDSTIHGSTRSMVYASNSNVSLLSEDSIAAKPVKGKKHGQKGKKV